ncbi:MAG: hypothetical protein HYV07_28235 [Deltaproteobacteria bacterium]|nr:hypothetical protein [Deltaproteobacteria bacterium]
MALHSAGRCGLVLRLILTCRATSRDRLPIRAEALHFDQAGGKGSVEGDRSASASAAQSIFDPHLTRAR